MSYIPETGKEYLDTVKRLEPDVHPLDRDGALASIAISLKRIADVLEANLGENAHAHDFTVKSLLCGIEQNGRS